MATVKDLIENLYQRRPKAVCVLKFGEPGDIEIEWSEIPIEILLAGHRALGLAIDNALLHSGAFKIKYEGVLIRGSNQKT